MAQGAGTFDTTEMVGIREDLANFISNVTPEDTPFTSSIGSRNVKSTFTEWQIDSLATPNANNKHQEGADYAYTDPSPTVRVGNQCQILRKTARTSKTADAVDTAGREKEHAYQVMKRGRELKRDRERIVLANQASNVAAATVSTVVRAMGAFPAWLETNARRGLGGADGGYNAATKAVDAATDATSGMRSFTEIILGDMLQDVFINSDASPKTLFMHPKMKRKFSAFSGISELRTAANKSGQQVIVAGADKYLSDWGELTVTVDRFQRARDVFAVTKEYVEMGTLRPIATTMPDAAGDYRQTVIDCEQTLIVKNEAAHGVAADLTS